PDEFGQAARLGYVEARMQATDSLQLVNVDRLLHTLDASFAEVTELEESVHQLGRRRRQADSIRRGDLLHARREPHGLSLRRVVHAQVVADLADDDLSGVDPHSDREVHAFRESELTRVASELRADGERRVTGPLRVVLMRDWRSEKRHDPVSSVLVDRAL